MNIFFLHFFQYSPISPHSHKLLTIFFWVIGLILMKTVHVVIFFLFSFQHTILINDFPFFSIQKFTNKRKKKSKSQYKLKWSGCQRLCWVWAFGLNKLVKFFSIIILSGSMSNKLTFQCKWKDLLKHDGKVFFLKLK